MTTTPNDLLSDIYQRMPVILPEKDHDIWLDPQQSDKDLLLSLLKPYPEAGMQRQRASNHVNTVRNEGPDCLKPTEI